MDKHDLSARNLKDNVRLIMLQCCRLLCIDYHCPDEFGAEIYVYIERTNNIHLEVLHPLPRSTVSTVTEEWRRLICYAMWFL
jgi:hypothetical protein